MKNNLFTNLMMRSAGGGMDAVLRKHLLSSDTIATTNQRRSETDQLPISNRCRVSAAFLARVATMLLMLVTMSVGEVWGDRYYALIFQSIGADGTFSGTSNNNFSIIKYDAATGTYATTTEVSFTNLGTNKGCKFTGTSISEIETISNWNQGSGSNAATGYKFSGAVTLSLGSKTATSIKFIGYRNANSGSTVTINEVQKTTISKPSSTFQTGSIVEWTGSYTGDVTIEPNGEHCGFFVVETAAGGDPSTKTVYLDLSSFTNWENDGAKFRIWDDDGKADIDMTKVNTDCSNSHLYSAEVPSASENLYFKRCKSDYSEKWNEASANSFGTNDAMRITNWNAGTAFVYTPSFSVTFDANGHGSAPASKCVTSGGKTTAPTDPTATGYTFGGWYKEAGCTNEWNFGSDVVTEDVTLYAKWTEKPWKIKGDFDGWTVHDLTGTASAATYTYTGLAASTAYSFGLENPSSTYYKGGSKITSSNTSTTLGTSGDNAQFETTIAGDYTFTVNYTNASAPVVTVTYPVPIVKVTSITLNKTTADVQLGGTVELTATVLPDNAANKNINWSSDNAKFIVSDAGVVSLNGAAIGDHATITATAADGSGVTGTCVVTVVCTNYLKSPEDEFTTISAATTWNFENETIKGLSANVDFSGSTCPTQNGEFIWSNLNFATGVANGSAIKAEGQRVNKGGYFQGQKITFETTVAGTVTVKFASNKDSKTRGVDVNGTKSTITCGNYTAVTTEAIPVAAGEVVLQGYQSSDLNQYLRWYSITFTPTPEEATWQIAGDFNSWATEDLTDGSYYEVELEAGVNKAFKIVKDVDGSKTYYTMGATPRTITESACENVAFDEEGGTENNTTLQASSTAGTYRISVNTTGATPVVTVTYPTPLPHVAEAYYIYLGQSLTLAEGVTAVTYDASDAVNNIPAYYYDNLSQTTKQYECAGALTIDGRQVTGAKLGKYQIAVTGGDRATATVYVYRYYAKYPWGACSATPEADYNKTWKWQALEYVGMRELKVYGLYSSAAGDHANLGWDYYYDWDGIYKYNGDGTPNLHPGQENPGQQDPGNGVFIDGNTDAKDHGGAKYYAIGSQTLNCGEDYIKLIYTPGHDVTGAEEPVLEESNFNSADGNEIKGTFKTITYVAKPSEGGVITHNQAGDLVPSGTKVTFHAEAKAGYVFAGWFTDADCKSEITGASVDAEKRNHQHTVTANYTVYAKFNSVCSAVAIHMAGDQNKNLEVGETNQLYVTYTPENPNIGGAVKSWESSNTAVITIDASGLVTAIGPGTTTITVTTTNDVTATKQITVNSFDCTSWYIHAWNGGNIRNYCMHQEGEANEWRTDEVRLPSSSNDEKVIVLKVNDTPSKKADWNNNWVPMVGQQVNSCTNNGNQYYAGHDALGYYRIIVKDNDAQNTENYGLAFQPTYVMIMGKDITESSKENPIEFASVSGEIYQTGLVQVPAGYKTDATYKYYVGTKRHAESSNSPWIYDGKSKLDALNGVNGLSSDDLGGTYGKFDIHADYCDANFYCAFIPYYNVSYYVDGEFVENSEFKASNGDAAARTISFKAAVEKTGYTFQNWKRYNSETTIDAGAPYAVWTGMERFDAQFTPTNYVITLNNQEATTAGTESVTATFDANTNLTSAITKPEKTGYTFGGYYTAENGEGLQLIGADGNFIASVEGYTDASKNWIKAEAVTLYAKWTEDSPSGEDVYYILYAKVDENGSLVKGMSSASSQIRKLSNGKLLATTDISLTVLPNSSKSGLYYYGETISEIEDQSRWSTSSNSNRTAMLVKYAAGTYTLNLNTLVATSIKFVGQSASAEKTMSIGGVEYKQSSKDTYYVHNYTKSGGFTGNVSMEIDGEFDGIFIITISSPTPADAWSMYYGTTTKVGDFTMIDANTFKLEGFELSNSTRNNICFKNNSTQYYVNSNNCDIRTKSALVEANNTFNFNTASNGTYDITITKENGTWYVQAAPATYTITYNKGANGTGTIANGQKTAGVNFTLSSSTFTRDGYTQTGWSLTDGGAKAYELGGTYTTDAALTLYPFWTENEPEREYAFGDYIFVGNMTVGTDPSKTITKTLTDYEAFKIDHINFSAMKLEFDEAGTGYEGWKIKTASASITFYVENDARVTLKAGNFGSNNKFTINYTNLGGSSASTNLSAAGETSVNAKGNTQVTITTTNANTAALQELHINNICTEPTLTWATAPVSGQVGSADATILATSNSAGAITYDTEDHAVATIVGGKLHYVAAGTTNVVATIAADGEYCEKTIKQSITVTAAPTYNLTVVDSEKDCQLDQAGIEEGQTVTVEYTCELPAGKHLTGYTSVPEVSGTFNSETKTYTFTMPAEDVTLTAVWEADCEDKAMMWKNANLYDGKAKGEYFYQYAPAANHSTYFTLDFHNDAAATASTEAKEAQNSSLNTGKVAGNYFLFRPTQQDGRFSHVTFTAKIQDANCLYTTDGTNWTALESTNLTGDDQYDLDLGEATVFGIKNNGTPGAASEGVWVRNMLLTICGESELVDACPVPTISAQSETQAGVEIGKADVELSVTTSDDVTYQWYTCNVNGEALEEIADANGATYTIPAAEQVLGIYAYICKVTTTCDPSRYSFCEPIMVEFIPAEFTIRYVLGVSDQTTTLTSERSTSSDFITNMTEVNAVGLTISDKGKDNTYSPKISTPTQTTFDEGKYVSLTFDVEDNYYLDVTGVAITVQPITCLDQQFKAVLSDGVTTLESNVLSGYSNHGKGYTIDFTGNYDASKHFQGTVTLKIYGIDTHTASGSHGDTYRLGKTLTIEGTVNTLPQPELDWTTAPEDGTVGGSMTIAATSDNSENTVTYTSMNPEIATVDAAGLLRYVAPGAAEIRATVTGDGINSYPATTTIAHTIEVMPAEEPENCLVAGSEGEAEYISFVNTSCRSTTYSETSCWSTNSSGNYLTYSADANHYFTAATINVAVGNATNCPTIVVRYSTDRGTSWTNLLVSGMTTAFEDHELNFNGAHVTDLRIHRNYNSQGSGNSTLYIHQVCFDMQATCTPTKIVVTNMNNSYQLGSGEYVEPTMTVKTTSDVEVVGAVLTYRSSNEEIATVDAQTGAVNFIGNSGMVTITAEYDGNATYCAADASYTITVTSLVPAPVIISTTTEITSAAGVVLTITNYDANYTYQWYADNGVIMEGQTSATFTALRSGDYYVVVTDGEYSQHSNTITLTTSIAEPKVRALVPFQYYHAYRLGENDVHENWGYSEQMKMRHLFVVKAEGTHSTLGKYQITATKNGSPVDLSATLSNKAGAEGTDTVMINLNLLNGLGLAENDTVVFTCAPADAWNNISASITASVSMHVIGDKPTLAFICSGANGDGTRKTGSLVVGGDFLTGYNKADLCLQTGKESFNKNAELPLYTTLKANYIVTPVNGYADFDKLNYEPFDLLLLTDYPKASKSTATKKLLDDMSELCDYRPMLSFKTHMMQDGYHKWEAKGFTSNPVVPTQTQKWINIVCYAHPMFDGVTIGSAGVNMEADGSVVFTMLDGTVYEGGKGIQGFTMGAAENFVKIAITHSNAVPVINEQDHTVTPNAQPDDEALIAACERQKNIEARMIMLSLNAGATSALTTTGIDVIKRTLDYLLETDPLQVTDCHFTFDNQTGDGKWSTAANWAPKRDILPNKNTDVRINANCTVDATTAVAAAVKLQNGNTLTIQPTGALSVGGHIYRETAGKELQPTTVGDIYIHSDEHGTGALIHGDKVGETKATVELYSIARGEDNGNGGLRNAQWQWMTTPFNDENDIQYNYYGSWMRHYNNATHTWEDMRNGSNMTPFGGYELTQHGPTHTYYMQGTLATTADQDIALTAGLNLIGNSWTAPINIQAMEVSDFENAEATIVMLNTGKDDDGSGEVTDVTAETSDNRAPGTYVSIPIEVVNSLGALQVIPSMQTFQIRTLKTEGVYQTGALHLDYNKIIRTSGSVNIQPLRTPGRQQVATDTDNGINEKLRIYVQGERYGDYLYLFQHDETTMGFDNGWDGRKYYSSNYDIPVLYVENAAGDWQISTQPELNGTHFGFYRGEDQVYTIGFQYDGYETLYLYDSNTDIYTEVRNSNTYTFVSYTDNKEQRFMLTNTRPQTPGISTGVDENGNDNNKVEKLMINGRLYILKRGHLYDAQGKMVK